MNQLATEALATQWAVIALVNALNASGNGKVVEMAKEQAMSHVPLLGDRPGIDAAGVKEALEVIFAQAGK